MFKMAVGHSDDIDPTDAIAAVIEQCRSSLDGVKPQAALLLSTLDSFEPSMTQAVRGAFPGVGVVGVTSAAEISSVNGYQEDSIALAVFASDAVDITVGIGAGIDKDVEAACQAAAAQATAGTTKEPKLCVMLPEAFSQDPQLTLNAMARALPEGVVIAGGASARSDMTETAPTYQFCNDTVLTHGVAVMLFSGPLAFAAAVGTGWKTLGPQGTVTRADHGSIAEIDDRPAIEFFSRYFDVTGPATFGNPLAVFEDGAQEYYLRTVLPSDPAKGSLQVMGSVPAGARVQVTTADSGAIIAGAHDALARASASFPEGAQPAAALVFSCAVRRFLLGSKTGVEAEMTRSAFGSAIPVAGLYCYGELGPVKGARNSRFLNETFVTLLLGA